MLVGDRMSHPVITISPKTTLEDALQLMTREHISRLPVIDKNGKMVGIISEKQVLRYSPSNATTLDAWEIKGVMSRMIVEKIMTTKVITVTPDTPLEEAASIMADKDINGIPVVNGDNVVGMITVNDIFKAFLEVLGAREAGVRLTVSISKSPGEIAELTKAIFDAGGNIISLGTFLGQSSDTGELTIKVEGIEKDKLVEMVKPCVKKVLDVREKVIW